MVVYNSIGQQVKTLVNKQMNAGIFHVSFDGSALPSGVYFARLTFTGKSVTAVKIAKLMLLK